MKEINSGLITAAIHSVFVYSKIAGLVEDALELEAMLRDVEFFRDLGKLESVKAVPDTAYEYYDRDRTGGDPYEFDVKTEERIANVKIRLLTFIADGIKKEEPRDMMEIFNE
jgi:hypothetical protein